MQRNEQYAPYRPPLTEEQKERIQKAEKPAEEYGRIAIEEAKKQLSAAVNNGAGQNAMPENAEACLRFPAIDPKGQYSIIDMKVSRRTQAIDAALHLRDKAVSNLVGEILNHPAVRERWMRLKQLSRQHRLFTRAEKLCWNEAAADSLHISARKLEVDPLVAEVDLVLQGVEHLLGLRQGRASREVADFYRHTLGITLTEEQYELGQRAVQPEELNVFFQDFDSQILQLTFSEPENWGLSMAELEKLTDET
ncbi:MAG: hypothetical protein IJV41_12845 [Oscillospiraceae bacterium]|nr:hypothetical protein [Oscillospiraceae bacterium]MBQ9721437.1 hypothetical protein [Oscillospiraceae bacterium]